MSPIALRLRELRLSRGWSQQDLADRAGLRQATISHLETGKAQGVDFDTLERLADALECDPGYLIVKE